MRNILPDKICHRNCPNATSIDLSSTLQTKKSFDLIKRVLEINSSAFVVGGYLRKLLHGKESMDIDIVTTDNVRSLAEALSKEINATVVNFKKGGITRLVSGGGTIDLSRMQGTIYDDLSKRDFTINAIAWSPFQGIVDPFGGIGDIKRGIVRAISEDNLKEDPLRMLRAYRFVAEDGYRINKETRLMIKRLRNRISITAKERVTSELFKILNSPYYMKAVRESFEDSLLRQIISINKGRLLENIKILPTMEQFIDSIGKLGYLNIDLNNEYSQGLTYIGLLRLERLLMGSNLNKNRLALSRAIWKRLESLQKAFKIYNHKKTSLDTKTLFDIFYELKEASIDFAIMIGRKKTFQEARRFLKMKDIISGDRIAEITGLQGKKIGDMLKKLRYFQFAISKCKDYT